MLCNEARLSSSLVEEESAADMVSKLQSMISAGASEDDMQQAIELLQEKLLISKDKDANGERVEDNVDSPANTSPHVTVDIFTSRMKHSQMEIASHLVDAVRSLENEPCMLRNGTHNIYLVSCLYLPSIPVSKYTHVSTYICL